MKTIPEKHRPTFESQQNLLLKLAKQQKEMQRLESLLASELLAEIDRLTGELAHAKAALASILDEVVGAYTETPAHKPFPPENEAMDKAKQVFTPPNYPVQTESV